MEMKDKNDLLIQLEDLKEEYSNMSELLDKFWQYHPSNPEFINPISAVEKLRDKLLEIEEKISKLEWKINSFN